MHDTANITAQSLSDVDVEKKGREMNFRLSLELPSQAPKVYIVPSLGKNDPWGETKRGGQTNVGSGDFAAYEHDDDKDRLRDVDL